MPTAFSSSPPLIKIKDKREKKKEDNVNYIIKNRKKKKEVI